MEMVCFAVQNAFSPSNEIHNCVISLGMGIELRAAASLKNVAESAVFSVNYTRCDGGGGYVDLGLNYIDITKHTNIQSRMVAEILAREVSKNESCYTLIYYQIRINTRNNLLFM